ncbi:hypothetical protein LJ80_12875 [Mycobacterium tuberculosis]|nr:hypothetical protein LJ80_12875 [Mycobacterium tuberculosis]
MVTVPSTALGTHCGNFGSALSRGWSRLGFDGFGGAAKLNVEVISPTVALNRPGESGDSLI